jgi:hypothetical protein
MADRVTPSAPDTECPRRPLLGSSVNIGNLPPSALSAQALGSKSKRMGRGPGEARTPDLLMSLPPQLQSGDLVRLEHRVPGVAVIRGIRGGDRDAKRLAVLDDLALCDHTSVRDLGDVALGGLGEPDSAVGRRRDALRADVG